MFICDYADKCADIGCDHYRPHEQMRDCSAGCDENSDGCTPVPAPLTSQQQVVTNTIARGYREGWTAEQFAARQVCKMVEEIGELICNIWTGSRVEEIAYWERLLNTAATDARAHFDDKSRWDMSTVTVDGAQSELADIQVVVFNLAAALAEITGEPFDVAQAAVDKSRADVERGVR